MNQCGSFVTLARLLTPAFLMLFLVNAAQSQDQRPGTAIVPPQASLPKIDAELNQILDNWERAGEVTQKLEGKHIRYIYDHVFFVEKRAEGKFYYEAPDKGRLDLEPPAHFQQGQIHQMNGKNYEIKKDKPERWICDGTQIFAIDEERDEFQRLPIPEENRGENIVDGPLPFLFGISKEKVVMRYHVQQHTPENGGKHDLQKGIIHLRVKPLWQQDAANWETAEVMLNARTYLPAAIKLIHPGGNAETVYVFRDVVRNAQQGFLANIWKGKDPFAPNLHGYKELTPTAMQGTNPLK